MCLRPLHMSFDTGDLGPQPLDPRLELLDRHRIEVLLAKLDQGVPGLAWEKVVEVHEVNR